MKKVEITKISETAKLPQENEIGYVIFADVPRGVGVLPGQKIKITTGIKVKPKKGYYIEIKPIWEMIEKGIILVQTAPITYEKEIILNFENVSPKSYLFKHHEPVAQIVVVKVR